MFKHNKEKKVLHIHHLTAPRNRDGWSKVVVAYVTVSGNNHAVN